ncbi:substrate-binding domain-containing protein [Salibaculum halophilum]|uniref:substrate-binding domain-containing protein n=1 Tax=Salibaculum halophilum TaxID=1914408 RepID=UPI001FEA2EDE|nr:substrate-binding domain-containing protein [Salibaculum halophilum]
MAGRFYKNNHDVSFSTLAKGSGTNIFDIGHGNWNRDDSFNLVQDFLSKHEQIDAVWALDDDMAEGVLAAIEMTAVGLT